MLNQNLSCEMRSIKLSGILRYKRITQSRAEDQTTCDNSQEKNCDLVDFVILADHRGNIEESNLDLTREMKNLWNMKVTMIPIIDGVFVTVSKSLEREPEKLGIRGRIKIIQILVFSKSTQILRRVLKTR